MSKTLNECPRYVIKQFVGEDPATQEFGGMRSIPSLTLWLVVVVLDSALFMGQIELFDCMQKRD